MSTLNNRPNSDNLQDLAASFKLTRMKRKQSDEIERGILLQQLSSICTYIILAVISLSVLLPFIWLISASLKDEFQYFAIPIRWLPQPILWSNYGEVFTQYNFLHSILTSLWLALMSVFISTLSSALIAYGFARFRFPGRTALFIIVLATMMMPTQMQTIPLFVLFRQLGWIDTFLPLLVPQLFGSALNIFLFHQFFIVLPRDLDEAAKIDGSGSLRIFWAIILPQSRSVLVVVGLFTFLASWQDTLRPLIYLTSDANRTVPLALLFFNDPVHSIDPQMMAATLIALVIPIILYTLGQRSIDSGVTRLKRN
jgi:multiple sugar transport system permease protein